jgi:3-oxoacyl-[acyl-carrier protein] reductase
MQITLKSATSHAEITEALRSKFGKIDALVNSAGYTRRVAHGDLATMTDELFNDILLANAGGTFSITRALMQASGNAVVVNVSSISAFTGSGSNLAYCAAKAALDTMAMSMARVFGPAVRFLCVSPASVDTGFVEGRSREEIEKKAAKTPLGRVVTAEDVALSVLACITHLKTATGTRIVIDGGQQL